MAAILVAARSTFASQRETGDEVQFVLGDGSRVSIPTSEITG